MQQFCLRWNNHPSNLLTVFEHLRQNESFVDVTLAVEGLTVRAHRMVLSACSPYFENILINNPDKHPIVFLKDVKYTELKALLDFMYQGEVSVDQENLSELLKVAESLKIKGLTEVREKNCSEIRKKLNLFLDCNSAPLVSSKYPSLSSNQSNLVGAQKRKRGRPRTLSLSQTASPVPVVNMEYSGFSGSSSSVADGENAEFVGESGQDEVQVIVKDEEESNPPVESASESNCSHGTEVDKEDLPARDSWTGGIGKDAADAADSKVQNFLPEQELWQDQLPTAQSADMLLAANFLNSVDSKEVGSWEGFPSSKKKLLIHKDRRTKSSLNTLLAINNNTLTSIDQNENSLPKGGDAGGSTVTRFSTLQDGTYACKLCHTTFTHPSNFHRHFITRHQRQRSFLCPVCKKPFNRRDNMTNHLRTVHKPADARQALHHSF